MALDVEPPIESAKTGHRWIDAAAALCALVISMISLLVAITNGQTNKQMVAANSWPFLQMLNQNSDNEGNLVIAMDVENAGVGPAKVETFETLWNEKPMKNSSDLLRACCAYSPPLLETNGRDRHLSTIPSTAPVAGTVIRAGASIRFFALALQGDNADVWRRLDSARLKIRFRTCYCSVFDECWISDLTTLQPKPVRTCAAPQVPYRQ